MKRDILYVDDETDNIVVFEAAFEDDFNVLTATTGDEAIAILETVPVPVVVADQRMPGMSGVELFEILRHKHPHTKRIILTGYTDQKAMLDAINKGQVFYFLAKPWSHEALMTALIRALEAHDLNVANSALTDQIVASQRLAMLGQSASRIAHEMGNQLLMLPLVELIQDKYSDCQDLVQMAQYAGQTHERLASLVEEILGFVRSENDGMSRSPLHLADAVHELISFLRFDRSIPTDKCNLQIKAEPQVVGNKVKIQQVMLNLLKNAAYAIRDRDGGRIKVSLESAGGDAVLSVSDNGCGMSEETLARIWEPYFSTKGKEGTGLGLDICRSLIENHGGRISCESQLDQGTTVVVRLPAIASLAAALPAPEMIACSNPKTDRTGSDQPIVT